MGNKNTKNIIFPKPPKIMSRSQYIEKIKDRIPTDTLLIDRGNSANNIQSTCPYCEKPNIYYKYNQNGGFSSGEIRRLGHFDICPELEKLWLKVNEEQKEAMEAWEKQIAHLTKLQAKINSSK